MVDESVCACAGTSFQYTPGLLLGGNITHECNPERSIGYYLEVLLCLAPFTKHPLDVTLTGVTNNLTDPSVGGRLQYIQWWCSFLKTITSFSYFVILVWICVWTAGFTSIFCNMCCMCVCVCVCVCVHLTERVREREIERERAREREREWEHEPMTSIGLSVKVLFCLRLRLWDFVICTVQCC